MSVVFITGGVRSGKSEFAEQWISARQESRVRTGASREKQPAAPDASVLYIATSIAADEEMARRIAEHRLRRPASWQTCECPYALPDMAALSGHSFVLLECLSGWVSNRLIQAEQSGAAGLKRARSAVLDEWAKWLAAGKAASAQIAIVSNEVGLGGVALYPLGRAFQDCLGEANKLAAAAADEVYAVISGIPWRLKG
ncbi:MAG TPA: bifunctional adenosylcobinamide kinase/adenosylcobinamide-phosphate guanylyltransferase [Bacilli bacterium]